MTKYFIFPVLFAAMACSTSTTTQAEGCKTQECLDQLDDTSVGGSDSSTGGSANGTGGNGTSVGGNSAATGGSTPITGGAASTGGNSTTAAGGATTICVPKTCADVAPAWTTTSPLSQPTACGTTTDGCGGILSCGDCSTVSDGTANTGCGQAPATVSGGTDWSGSGLVPVSNVCGNRCIRPAADRDWCSSGTSGWRCPSTTPPLGLIGCTITNSAAHTWCCNT